MQHFVEICGFAIYGFIMKMSDFRFADKAHLCGFAIAE
jgi:hypothetical protein